MILEQYLVLIILKKVTGSESAPRNTSDLLLGGAWRKYSLQIFTAALQRQCVQCAARARYGASAWRKPRIVDTN